MPSTASRRVDYGALTPWPGSRLCGARECFPLLPGQINIEEAPSAADSEERYKASPTSSHLATLDAVAVSAIFLITFKLGEHAAGLEAAI
ncbi:hypothetical protein PsYK624_009640 [Phanerochaete sordida]|uniref:Uncharacterized protein n=1 Tax=Phanerochaete sordida TaxID=48140 RepID=A0A9P3FXE0_9APHY|nr:hypothetical protein PsYK624_009640 [Phanerochaete sordida]